jgi:hypothetical protein
MENKPDLKHQVHVQNFAKLRQLRDEIRLKVHLAGMEARDAWRKLEPRFGNAERLVVETTETSRRELTDLVERFKQFLGSIQPGKN